MLVGEVGIRSFFLEEGLGVGQVVVVVLVLATAVSTIVVVVLGCRVLMLGSALAAALVVLFCLGAVTYVVVVEGQPPDGEILKERFRQKVSRLREWVWRAEPEEESEGESLRLLVPDE